MPDRIELIRKRLEGKLAPLVIEIDDQSALHAGHPGASAGGGHFSLRIVSDKFHGRSLLQRHRLVYDALGDLMHGEIHAVRIQAHTPEEQ